jgi:DNA-binding transcriptional regulator YiaG
MYMKIVYAKVAYTGRAGLTSASPMPKSVFTDAYASAIAVLVALRKERGVSQVELARRLGKTQQFVSAMERGERRLDIVEYYAVVRALGGDLEALFLSLIRSMPDDVEI